MSEFEYKVLSEQPAGSTPIYIPGEASGGGRDGIIVKFNPIKCAPWVGIFAFGDMLAEGECKVYPGPGLSRLTIVAKGDAYIVNPDDPSDLVRVKSCPAIRALTVASLSLVVFYDYTELVAYNEEGLVWETERISWDGIEIDEVSAKEIIGKSWDAPNERYVEFRVNLDDGRHQGGSAPPEYPAS